MHIQTELCDLGSMDDFISPTPSTLSCMSPSLDMSGGVSLNSTDANSGGGVSTSGHEQRGICEVSGMYVLHTLIDTLSSHSIPLPHNQSHTGPRLALIA
jgi:hypothetical protein